MMNRYDWDINKANTYSAIIAVVTIYLIILSYVLYYFKEDFIAVFGKKKDKVAEKQKLG